MPDEDKNQLRLEIGHILFIDIVGYFKGLINQQSESLHNRRRSFLALSNFALAEAEGN